MLPDALKRFLGYMDANDLPAGYRDAAAIGKALRGISQRLSRANPLAEAMPLMLAEDDALKATFDRFFPQLQAFAAHWVAERMAGPPADALTWPGRPST
jgi:acyl carrier protein phosphodiesterase